MKKQSVTVTVTVMAVLFTACGAPVSGLDDGLEPVPAAAPNSGGLRVEYTTAFHPDRPFRVAAGAKNIIFGTFLFVNSSTVDAEVRSVLVRFLATDSSTGGGYAEGQMGAARVADHVENCRLIQWPELVVFMGPTGPDGNGHAYLHDPFTLKAGAGQGAALDIVCDITPTPASGYEAFAADILLSQDVQATVNGTATTVAIAATNGIPPKVSVIIGN